MVIDDKEDEASALIRALSERDIPVLYFKGREKELPRNPLTGIRVVFLDMKLEGMERQEPETIASSLMQLLKKAISNVNGPYLIFAWTKHEDVLKVFQEQLGTRGLDVPKPCFLVNMEKTACMSDGKLDYATVSNQLGEKLGELPLFKFLTKWERTVADSQSEVISLVSSMVEGGDVATWKDELGKILYQIADAQSGRALEEKDETISHSAMKALDSILRDCIEKRVSLIDEEFLERPANVEINDDIKATINTRINLRDLQTANAGTAPGNLYILRDFEHLREYLDYLSEDIDSFKKGYFNSMDGLEGLKFCMLEITPICDYACRKWRASRLLVGFLVPAALEKKIKDADFLYTTPLFSLEGHTCYLVFNFYYMALVQFNKLNDFAPRYQVRIDLLSDIQSKFSAHISRRGVVKLE